MFLLKKLVSILILPPAGFILLSALGLFIMYFKKKTGLVIVWVGLALMWLVGTPYCSEMLWNSLKVEAFDIANVKTEKAIVILGGGVARNAEEYGQGANVAGASSLQRLHYGVWLHRKLGLPILLSGGAPAGGEAEADAMARVLQEDYGIKAGWIENQSNDTHDNAVFSSAMLQKSGIEHALLVTEGFHMRRSVLEFQAAGLNVTAAPTRINYEYEYRWRYLPGAASLRSNTQMIKEWMGLAVFSLSQ